MSKRKRFSQKLYDKYDILAKLAFKKYLENFGVTIIDEPYGKFGIDLAVMWPDKSIVLFDVEVRPIWKADRDEYFPFPTVHVPERKEKFLTYEYPTYFVSFRNDYKAFVVVDGKDVTRDCLEPVKNRFVTDGEQFFAIDINKCKEIHTGV